VSAFRAKSGILLAAALPLFSWSYSFAAPSFTSGVQVGAIENAAITEASGIAASRMNPNVLWTQEDSGNPAQIYAMTPAGTNLGTYTLSGAGNTDWEDIDVGPGPAAGTQYVYAGDIGDNFLLRSTIAVYRVPEPTVSDTQSPVTATLGGVSKFTLAYPDGAHDAESMFVDPLTRDIYIITKRDATYKYVYRAAYPQSTSGTTTLSLAATLTNANALTAADMSPDGSQIIIRSYATSSGLLYQRPSNGTVADAFATTPIAIPLVSEGVGEAIGFDPQGRGYYTTSEGTLQPIYYFDRLPPPAAAMYWDNDAVVAGNYITNGAGLGGTGTWNASSLNWYGGSCDVAWQNGNDAVFWGAAGTVTLATAQSVNSLAFKTNGYMIAASTLTLDGPLVTIDVGVTATVSSIVAGSAGLVKDGAGTLVLTNSSNQTSGYTGGTTINAGTLNVASGAISHSGVAVTINNGSTLQFTGNFTLAAARSVTLGPGGGVVDVQGNTDTIAGPISGTSLTKIGAGTLSLTNANTHTGGTTVDSGTLLVSNNMGSGTGTGSVVVNADATLGGTGTIAGAVLVNSGGHIAPGANIGSLDLGALTLVSGSILDYELNTLAGVDTSDLIDVTTSGGLTISGGTLNLTNAGGMTAGTYTLVNYAEALNGNLSNISFGTTPSGFTYSLVNNAANTSIDLIVGVGDFNVSGTVDAADYVLWRKRLGTTYAPADYDVWRTNFGTAPSGGVGTGSESATVPEPVAWPLLATDIMLLTTWRNRSPVWRKGLRRKNKPM
jgi:autotransporter-associated beta strand protein